MSLTARRVVITGLGLLTPIGNGRVPFVEALSAGKSGIRRIQSFDPISLPSQIGGELHDFDIKQYLDKKEGKRASALCRTVQYAMAASRLALADAGLTATELDPTRFGISFGGSTIAGELAIIGDASRACLAGSGEIPDPAVWGRDSISMIPPLWMLNHVPNMPACHVSILNNAQGPINTVTQIDASSLMAVGEAFRIIRRNSADVMLAGGADDRINPISTARQNLFNELSRRTDAPEKASRPFDLHRDGEVLGDGAGLLIIEEYEQARQRSANVYAEIIGYGAAFDTDRNGEGIGRAIVAAMKEAQIEPGDLDHVNAHGHSKRKQDTWEARGINRAGIDTNRSPIFAPRSYFGGLGTAGSVVELAASLATWKEGFVPATLNYETPDTECAVTVLVKKKAVERPYFLKISFTSLGQCAAMVLKTLENGG